MNIYQTIAVRLFGIALIPAIMLSCGGKPAQFNQTAGEMKEGPGVLTGEEGALIVYDSKQGGAFPQLKKEMSEAGSKEASEKAGEAAPAATDAPAGSTQMAAGQSSAETQVSPEAAKEFQEFQEWKKEQKSFQEFQEWKKSAKGKAEYQEFLDWKEWKSYQEWKKQQGQ
jgi:hypothetical protein